MGVTERPLGGYAVGKNPVGFKKAGTVRSEPFTFPPGAHPFTPPVAGYWKFVAWGSGGSYSNGTDSGASGAYGEITQFLTTAQTVAIVVGGGATSVTFPSGAVATAGGGGVGAGAGGTASGFDFSLNGTGGVALGGGSSPGAGLGTGGGAGGGINGGAGAPARLPYRGGNGGKSTGPGNVSPGGGAGQIGTFSVAGGDGQVIAVFMKP